MKLHYSDMTLGLVVGIAGAVVVACATGAYLYSGHHFDSLLETARSTALTQGDLIRVALEHQMIENDRSLIARMIESFGRQPRVERVVLLDRNGLKRYSGGPRVLEELSLDSPTCQACHQYAPEQRSTSRVIETKGGTVLRTVIPIHNREACHACHDPGHKINGILLLDYDAGEIHATMSKDLRWLVGGSTFLALALVGVIALVYRVAVLRRLQRFETTARQIASGDLEKRVPADGSDIVAWLAQEFNTMADSVTGLVGEVRHQRERLENVINSIDDGIVVLDGQRKVLAANEAFLKRAGRSRPQAIGNCCLDLAPGMCSVHDCPTHACLHTGGSQVRVCERRTSDGDSAWEEIHASPVLDSTGNLTQVVEVWRDISERRQAEARLAESHRLASLGMLASGFSHELNTPLATVLTCVEGILRDCPSPVEASTPLARIRESALIARDQILRCRGTTQHFLRLSRGRTASGGIVDLNATVASVERLVGPTARSHSVHVEVQPLPQAVHIRADEADLQHALVNLLLNAIQASKSGDTVVLCMQPGERIRIRVSDSGCGIPANHLKQIFEPFFSLRSGGTGLGLFLSLDFVRRWGGDIQVQSTVGKGSTFEIIMPAMSPMEEATATS